MPKPPETKTKKTTSTKVKRKSKSSSSPPAVNGSPAAGSKPQPVEVLEVKKGEVIYPHLDVRLFLRDPSRAPSYEVPGPLTAEVAREILDWQEEPPEGKGLAFGDNYLLKYTNPDGEEKKVRCGMNITNRPFYPKVAENWMYEILNGNWKFNGESMIFDNLGMAQDAQHRLVGLILAVNEWHLDQKRERALQRWQDIWREEPSIDALIVVGVESDDKTINTIGTGKPRSLADALYRHSWFNSMPPKDRERAVKTAETAVNLLWERTAQNLNSFAPRRSHSEAFEFIERHPRILKCVKFIREETKGKKDWALLNCSMGYSAALLYLMGCCTTDASDDTNPKRYDVVLNESALDWELYDRAEEFFIDLIGNGKATEALREELYKIPREVGGHFGKNLRIGMVIKAWNLYSDGKKITAEGVRVETGVDENENKTLAESPKIGGIDVG